MGGGKAGEGLDINDEVTNIRCTAWHVDFQFLSGLAVRPTSQGSTLLQSNERYDMGADSKGPPDHKESTSASPKGIAVAR